MEMSPEEKISSMVTTLGEERGISAYRKSSIKHPLSNKPSPFNKSLPPFQEKKVNTTLALA